LVWCTVVVHSTAWLSRRLRAPILIVDIKARIRKDYIFTAIIGKEGIFKTNN